VRLYLDSADRAAAEPLLATGLFAGLTTNPTILRRAGRTVSDIPAIHRWASAANAGEIFFQAWGEDAATLVKRGRELRDLGDDVVVKLVATRAGVQACATLAADGIPTLITAVYTPAQALIAAAAGASYIAPYLGQMQSHGLDGYAEIVAMHEALTATGGTTRVLLASVRDVAAVARLARHGIRHATMSPAVAEGFFTDELTEAAARTFEEAAAG
jgi:TalC/MipB family fructose-6-phosphate aldolase